MILTFCWSRFHQFQLAFGKVVGVDARSTTAITSVIDALKTDDYGIKNTAFFYRCNRANVAVPIGFGTLDFNGVSTFDSHRFLFLNKSVFQKKPDFLSSQKKTIHRVCPVYLMPNFTSFPLVVDNSPQFAITNLYIPRSQPVRIFYSIHQLFLPEHRFSHFGVQFIS
jgi:hypothetical protein